MSMSRWAGPRWQTQPVTAEQRRALFHQSATFDTLAAANTRAIRTSGYYVGAAGAIIGVCGMVCAASLFPLKQTVVQFVPFNADMHLTGASVTAADAPKALFGEQQAHADLFKFVSASETWINDVADLNFHVAAIMSTRAQQAMLAERMAGHNPASPRALYGNKESIRVERFRYRLLAKASASDFSGNQIWQVRYDRSEVVNGMVGGKRPWISTITFAWHPELMASDTDRAINETGFQCAAYESGPE